MIEYTVKVWPNGNKEWWLNGKSHREDGPAVEWAGGTKEWWLNGKSHREDGPAVEWADGYKEWYLNGEMVTEQEVMGPSRLSAVEIAANEEARHGNRVALVDLTEKLARIRDIVSDL